MQKAPSLCCVCPAVFQTQECVAVVLLPCLALIRCENTLLAWLCGINVQKQNGTHCAAAGLWGVTLCALRSLSCIGPSITCTFLRQLPPQSGEMSATVTLLIFRHVHSLQCTLARRTVAVGGSRALCCQLAPSLIQ